MTEKEISFDDLNIGDVPHTPDCMITCRNEIRYNNIVECAKETGDKMAQECHFKSDIVIYFKGKAWEIRRYVPADYDEETYEKFLDVVDPYRPIHNGYKKNPIILDAGYYTDWIKISQ